MSPIKDYDRRMRLKASGIDLEVVMDVVCAHLGVNTAELSGPSRRQQICQALALISRARAEDFGSRRGPPDEQRSLIRQPSLGTGSGRSGAKEYEQSIALPSVPGRLNILPPHWLRFRMAGCEDRLRSSGR